MHDVPQGTTIAVVSPRVCTAINHAHLKSLGGSLPLVFRYSQTKLVDTDSLALGVRAADGMASLFIPRLAVNTPSLVSRGADDGISRLYPVH